MSARKLQRTAMMKRFRTDTQTKNTLATTEGEMPERSPRRTRGAWPR